LCAKIEKIFRYVAEIGIFFVVLQAKTILTQKNNDYESNWNLLSFHGSAGDWYDYALALGISQYTEQRKNFRRFP